MNGKIIATLIALGMVVSAFAMLATPVNAATPMTYHFYDTTSWADERLRLTTSDAMDPDGGVARWLVQDTPAQINTDVTTDGGMPLPGMSAWIGPNGRSGLTHYVMVQTAAVQAEPTAGEPIMFFLEKDPNIAVEPMVYIPTSAAPPYAGGTVPDGHIWVGTDVHAWGDVEPLISGSPPTTFFEILDMPTPVVGAASTTWAGVTHPAAVCGNTNANIVSWQLFECVDNNGPWAQVGTAAFGAPIAYVAVANMWYSVGVTYFGNVRGMVLSTPVQFGPPPPGTAAPESVIGAEAGVILTGNIANEFVTITATITDTEAPADNIIGAEIEIPTGSGSMYAMTTVSPVGSSRVYTYQYDCPNGQLVGIKNYRIHGQDDGDGWNATWIADTFTYTDTAAPIAAWAGQPAASLYTTQPANFQIGYADFSAYTNNVLNTYISWRVQPAAFTNFALTNFSFAWGSFTNIFTYQIPGGTFVAGNVVDYTARITDGNGNIVNLAAGQFTVANAPAGVQDPYPVFGYVRQYNGAAGVYAPITSTGGDIVTATWISSFNGAVLTRTDTTNALGQFSIDLMNYTDTNQVWLTVPGCAPYVNNGYNYTTVQIAGFPGGRQQNILCGIPYNVEITVPVALATEIPGVAFPTTYVWYDIDGVQCPGYYSFGGAAGFMDWRSSDPLFVPPADYQFNGIADLGTHNDLLTLFTAPSQWINISEGGALELNPWSTPWGAIQVPTTFVAGNVVLVNGFLKDWDQITLNLISGGFDWNVVNGWNIVSVPQDPVNKGLVAGFDAYDALQYCAWQLPGVTDLSLFDRTGGNPSTYAVFDYGMAEAAAFPMDGVHGYWVYSNVAGICHFNATNYSAIGANVVNAVAGWNLLGFTHNYTTAAGGWLVDPTASDWCDGTVSATLGAVGKVVATEWLEAAAPQWYNSYVDMAGFPGMATHDWVWDGTYSGNPGNGLFLWLEAPAVITFNRNF